MKAFQEYNTYLQLGLLGSGLMRAKFNSVRKSAEEEYIKHRDALVNNYGADDVRIKEIDGHFGLISKVDDIVRGVSKNNFINSVPDFAGDPQLADEAWDLFIDENWVELENLFKINNINFDPSINNVWPPNFGFKSITKIEKGDQLNSKIFDRFQKYEDLSGGYASPVPKNSTFSLQSRALGVNYDDLDNLGGSFYYIKFKFKEAPFSLEFQYGEAIPWFEELGGAVQVKSSENLRNISDNIEVLEKWKYENGKWKELKFINGVWK